MLALHNWKQGHLFPTQLAYRERISIRSDTYDIEKSFILLCEFSCGLLSMTSYINLGMCPLDPSLTVLLTMVLVNFEMRIFDLMRADMWEGELTRVQTFLINLRVICKNTWTLWHGCFFILFFFLQIGFWTSDVIAKLNLLIEWTEECQIVNIY